jgi:predicted MPP superfamily phosphohydrolase
MSEKVQDSLPPDRWDPNWKARRKEIEAQRDHQLDQWPADNPFPLPVHYRFLKWFLETFHLYGRGYRNFLDIQVNYVAHRSIYWPVPLSGLRILQISDLHIDLDPALMKPLCEKLGELHCDLVVFTGDFWEGVNSSMKKVLACMEEIFASLPDHSCGKYGVLGNHDSLELASALEQIGLPILVNEAVVIESTRGSFTLAGVDDPFVFQLDDLEAAVAQCPSGIPKILLSHSPQIAAQADDAGFAAMLSGHTHGGQICLPGGYSPISMKGIPPRLFKGLWRQGNLCGYTSSGTGACHIPVRYNCPPELTIHTLNNAGQI